MKLEDFLNGYIPNTKGGKQQYNQEEMIIITNHLNFLKYIVNKPHLSIKMLSRAQHMMDIFRENGIPNGFYMGIWEYIMAHDNPIQKAIDFFESDDFLTSPYASSYKGIVASSPFVHTILNHKDYINYNKVQIELNE